MLDEKIFDFCLEPAQGWEGLKLKQREMRSGQGPLPQLLSSASTMLK